MNKFKVGDRVRVIDLITGLDDVTTLEVGDVGTIVIVDDYSDICYVKFDKELERTSEVNFALDGSYIMDNYQLELINTRELKVGDLVQIIEPYNICRHYLDIGELVEIVDVDYNGRYDVVNEDGMRQSITSDDFIQLPFQIGDRVVFTPTQAGGGYFGIIKEMLTGTQILTIEDICECEEYELEITIEENIYSYHPTWLELVEDESINSTDGFIDFPSIQMNSVNTDEFMITTDTFDYDTFDYDEILDGDMIFEIKQVGEIKRLLKEEGFTDEECMTLIMKYFIHQL